MGVFDFIKDVGSSVFGDGEESEKVKDLLREELGDKIQDLEAEVSEAVAKLKGNCDSLPTKEKAILLTGNIEGIEQVDGTDLQSPPPGERPAPEFEELNEATESEFYEIKSGDTLSKIAKEYYGDANKYPLIFKANREVIKDADKIYPGQKIRIPKLA